MPMQATSVQASSKQDSAGGQRPPSQPGATQRPAKQR
jgi:hypothetical protein